MRADLALALIALIWGTTFVLVKRALEDISPFLYLALRFSLAALVLAVFTVAAGVIFHAYWGIPAEQVMMQKINFYKNLAIGGGLLAFVAFGAGGLSLDARLKRD